MNKAKKGEQGEKKVISVLDRIKEDHFLLNNVTLVNASSQMSHQIDHVLIHPNGLFVIETKNYSGEITVDPASGKWTKRIRAKTSKISDPLRQNKSHAIALRKALKSRCKPIPVVVFVQNNAPYLPDENIINLDDLLLFIDSYPFEKRYSQEERAELKRLIESMASEVSLKEHLENIKIIKKAKKEMEAEMTYAIERGLCPICNSKLNVSGYEYRCTNCGYHFKL